MLRKRDVGTVYSCAETMEGAGVRIGTGYFGKRSSKTWDSRGQLTHLLVTGGTLTGVAAAGFYRQYTLRTYLYG